MPVLVHSSPVDMPAARLLDPAPIASFSKIVTSP